MNKEKSPPGLRRATLPDVCKICIRRADEERNTSTARPGDSQPRIAGIRRKRTWQKHGIPLPPTRPRKRKANRHGQRGRWWHFAWVWHAQIHFPTGDARRIAPQNHVACFLQRKTCKPTALSQAAAACKPEQPPITMKLIPTLSCFSLALLLSATAQVKETTTEKTTKTNADGTVEDTTTTTTTFNPEVQTKVVKYFDTYKTLPYGLPPEWSTRMKIKEIPPAWRTARVAPGTVFAEDVRPFLLEAPPALVKVLPPPTAEVRYYVAGGSVVAIDKTYKVVDSIQIPTVKFEVEVDDDEIKVKKKEKDD